MTNTNIQQFDFNNQQVRVITDKQGEPWFVAKDVCDILELGNVSQAVSKLDDDEKSNITNNDIAQNGGKAPLIVSEAGLYSLVLKSRKPEAREFKRWVTHEVLPSIRKHGGYMSGQEQLSPEELVLKSMQYLQSKIDEQRSQLEAQAPKVLFADAYSASDKCILVGELAKILTQNGYRTGQNRLFKQFQQEGYLMKKNGNPHFPTQKSVELGLFEVKTTIITHSNGEEKPSFTTKVTPKGQAYFIRRYLRTQQLDLEA